jgi:hypothetical protein
MTSSLLLLSALISLPYQAPAPAGKLPPGYRDHQLDLWRIHEDMLRLKDDSQLEIMALNEQAAEIRNQDGTLVSRLLIFRQSARSMDSYCQQSLERIRQWDKLNNHHGDAGLDKQFHLAFDSKEIIKKRALVRKLTYMEIMNHQWSGETARPNINYRIMDGLSQLLTNGDGDKLLLGLGWVDVVATDLCSFLGL